MSNNKLGPGDTKAVAHYYPRDTNLLKFLVSEYGDTKFIGDINNSLVNFGLRFWKKNKKYQNTLRILKYGVPAFVMSSQFIAKLRYFKKIKKGENNVVNEKDQKILQLLEVSNKSFDDIDNLEFNLGKEVNYWILKKPRTKLFKIINIYESENMNIINDIWKFEKGNVLITLEFENKRFVWDIIFNRFDEEIVVIGSSLISLRKNNRSAQGLTRTIFKEFVNSLDISKNVIYLHEGLSVRERKHFKENIDQLNVEKFAAEIKKVIKRKKKRGYGFVGLPGTGKSTIIRKLENLILEYPFIYANPDNFRGPRFVDASFNMIKSLQPCIVILEDTDSYGFETKNAALGSFLNQIDDVNRELNCVFIATINDTNQVHYSLINRPGRFDQIITVNPPQGANEIYNVMSLRFKRIKSEEPDITIGFPAKNEINEDIFTEIRKNNFTQADICEVIEKSIYISDDVNNNALIESIEELKNTKEAIKKYNFNKSNPFEDMDNEPIQENSKVIGSCSCLT